MKKITALLLCAAMALSLAACGGGGGGPAEIPLPPMAELPPPAKAVEACPTPARPWWFRSGAEPMRRLCATM